MTAPQTPAPGPALSEISLDVPEGDGVPSAASPNELLATAKPPRAVNRKAAAAIGAVLALAVVGSFGVWAKGWIADADRTTPTVYWQAVEPAPATASPTRPVVSLGALGDRMLPVPEGYLPGPDLDGHSDFFTVPGAKAAQLMKENNRNLPASRRAESDKLVDQLKLKGQAGRSLRSGNGDRVVEIQITQADPQAVEQLGDFTKKLVEFLGDDRKAPKVEGYPEAKCALRAVGEEEKNDKGDKRNPLESVVCVASQGDFLISFHAYGVPPFNADEEVKLFRKQLDRVKSPGESV
ncbi:hypothetical protein [Streptomyces sp. G-G2]|uniref:hypothetical protein n=1 Tax=Streptomyces sp. G-G2 TaxID=3046201 RepID=UPI0024B96377|nr:hypothetical protein [Streptomyces sp. G-G2]MDJ0384084.1 hypothetical protein [Streptomyces sp. G-G2]